MVLAEYRRITPGLSPLSYSLLDHYQLLCQFVREIRMCKKGSDCYQLTDKIRLNNRMGTYSKERENQTMPLLVLGSDIYNQRSWTEIPTL